MKVSIPRRLVLVVPQVGAKKRGQAQLTGTARRVLRMKCACPLFFAPTCGTTIVFTLAMLFILAPCVEAQNKTKFKVPDLGEVLPLLNAKSPQALSGVLRGVLIKHLPNPLYEASPGWGHTVMVRRVRWEKRGFVRYPRVKRVPRPDGTWRQIRFEGLNLPNTLVLDIRHVRFPEPNRMLFEIFLAFDGRAEFTQQNWERGIRLWSGTVRARFRVKLQLFCEASTTWQPNKKSFLPDAVFRMHATKANASYDNLVYEHVPGIGGSAARIIGKTFHSALNQWRPSIERRLLEKANAAIVRAADTREVRLSLSRVFNSMLKQR